MEFTVMIINAFPFIIIALILISGIIAMLLNQRESAKKWLLLAVTEAEKSLGSGMGALKLRECYQHFVSLYPTLAKFITFEEFKKWVDNALVEMKEMLKSNKKIEEYINGSE